MRLELTPSLAMKLGSLAVHADEATGPHGHQFDMSAIRTLVEDSEVSEWLDDFGTGLLPVKRDTTQEPSKPTYTTADDEFDEWNHGGNRS